MYVYQNLTPFFQKYEVKIKRTEKKNKQFNNNLISHSQ